MAASSDTSHVSGRGSRRAPPSLRDIVQKLRTGSSSNLEDGLQMIQGLVRKNRGLEVVDEFRRLGGLEEIVQVVKSDRCDIDRNEKLTDLALSVLATCCREQESKIRVHELEGIPAIVEVLKAHTSVSIINRASRALANLAEVPKLCADIHHKDIIPQLIRLLKETPDSSCRQSILRLIRILADTNQHAWKILQSEGLSAVLNCLDSDDIKLIGCAAQTAAELTNHLGSGQSTEALRSYQEAGRQAVEDNRVEVLVRLLSHSKPSIQDHALVALLNLMVSEGVRVAAGKAGGVEVFIERGKATTFPGWATYIHCLCFCCREAVNRVRLRNLEGLQVLLNILKSSSEDCVRLHETILVALMDFYYDEQSLNYLAACGFIQVLVSQLRQEVMTSARSGRDDLTESEFDSSMSSSRCTDDVTVTGAFPSTSRKRARSFSEGPDKKQVCNVKSFIGMQACSSKDTPLPGPKAKKTCLLAPAKPQDDAQSRMGLSSTAMSVTIQATEMMEDEDTSSSLPSSSASGMSPESSATNYQSYINPEATPYSPPSVDWEWFLQHREQMGQGLSPRSFSSFSSPRSLSPLRYDFSPMSSPQWSPQWSPQHSPEYSHHQAPQWSPQHSPQWEPQPSPDQSDHLFPQPLQENESPVSESLSQTLSSKPSTLEIVAPDEPPTAFGHLESVGASSKDVQGSTASIASMSEEAPVHKSLIKSHQQTLTDSLSQGSTLQAVCNLTLDEKAKISKVGCATDSLLTEKDILMTGFAKRLDEHVTSINTAEYGQEAGTFREPHSKSLRMRTGRNKTTSVHRQTADAPSMDDPESDTNMLSFMGSKEPKEKILVDKFEIDMEIRRAKEEGKLRRREYAAVTLLSRYSHMDDPSTHMARESVVSVLLDYQPSSAYLQSKSQRTLHRILRNRLCFEQLIMEHIPMLIARKMIERESKKLATAMETNNVNSTVKRSQSTNDLRSMQSRAAHGEIKTSGGSSQEMRDPRKIKLETSHSSVSEPKTTSTEVASSRKIWPRRKESFDSDVVSDFLDDSASDTTSVCSLDTVESEQSQLWGDTASPLYPLMVSTCQFRQGTMLRLLMSNSFKGKMACVLAIPYICQTNSLKRRLLIKHKGLQILLDFLRKDTIMPDTFNKAVQCLFDLSTALFLNPDETETILKTDDRSNIRTVKEVQSQEQGCCYDAVEQQADTKLLVDQEEAVQAHRSILTKSSEYFTCLLEGPYLESGQSEVPLKEISKEALTLILHSLYGCLHLQCCHMNEVTASGDKVVLEAIACSGRFLLWPVQNRLCDIIVDSHISAASVVSHFQFGLKHNCSKLTNACLMFMLTSGKVTHEHFQELVERGCANDAFKTIERMITDALFSIN
ncbi:uncharacterized protein LOC110985463 [Acanthaster planci]|uniref:Uncharacterized protein LOC110985463 n=1 Tax=Acanthaster planci TaxID=133434 RepID=A0A8B7Z949_ACAPL|nr:uncharacterized protein LOC110985463 [Acanthaster planci]